MIHLLHRVAIPSPHNGYRPHILRRGVVAVFLMAIVSVEGYFAVAQLRLATDSPALAAVVAADIVSFTNKEREKTFLPDLKENIKLNEAAATKAKDMAAKGYFSHVSPDGTEPWHWLEVSGYEYQDAGENLAVRFADSSSVVDAWMGSASHRANILDASYTEIGVGTASGTYQGKPTTFVVQYFGRPATGGEVLGAVVSKGAQSFVGGVKQALLRALGYVQANPLAATSYFFGALLVVFLVVGVCTLLFHVSIFPAIELAGALVLMGVLSVLLYANNAFFALGALPGDFAASVVSAPFPAVVTEDAAVELPLITSSGARTHR